MEDYIEFAVLEDDTAEITRYEGSAQTVAIPDSLDGYPVTVIGKGAFAENKALRFLSIPEGVREIGDGAFRLCVELASVVIPEGAVSIGREAFKDCRSLCAVTLPSSLGEIGAEAFRGCCALKKIAVPKGVNLLPERALSGCSSLAEVSLPETLQEIGYGALSKCVALTGVHVPPQVKTIGGDAFFSCAALADVMLPDGLESIGDRAFYGCAALTRLNLPASLREIGSGALYGCTGLTLVVPPDSFAQETAVRSGLPFAHGIEGALYYRIRKDGAAEALRYTGDETEFCLPASLGGYPVRAVASGAFRFCASLRTICLPDGLEEIGANAFHGCASLENIRLPESLRAIGADAFKACSALGEITLPAALESLGGYAFYGCAALDEIALPDGIAEIGSFTFCDCVSLKHIRLPQRLTSIGMSAFNGCTALSGLELPQTLSAIGAKAFKGCRSLPCVTLPGALASIGLDAFVGCSCLVLRMASGSAAHDYAKEANLSFLLTDSEGDAPRGVITEKTEFLFPDTPLGDLPESLRVACAQNGMPGLQILFECAVASASIRLIAPQFDTEIYQLVDVPVEYNSGDGQAQGGAMVILPDNCPDYAIRKAPFRVYDCLRPMPEGIIPVRDGRAGAYVCFAPRRGLPAGMHTLYLEIVCGEKRHVCEIACQVYPVAYDEDRFETTNWFSVCAMEKMHGVTRGTPEFEAVMRAYARSMRRVHQKVFLLWMHEDLSERRTQRPYHFDFEDMKPIIEIFFDEGFDTFETGGIICRGYREDGSPDMYTADLKCSANPAVSVDSEEGYALLCSEMQAFSEFLMRNGWQDRVLFHVMDEPDVHYKSDADLQARRLQFFIASNIVRRYLPGVKIIEAVKTTKLLGGVDIMVPITDGYQQFKQAFDEVMAMGGEVWTYVCCAPLGKWLNRLLDQPLINGRLLFWGCALNRISGYLHWGYNQFGGVPDPFTATSAHNWTGIGTNFPCGDAFIVYPGKKEPWPSMRLEAERRGAEDAALLYALLERDPAAHDALIRRILRSFNDYDSDPAMLEALHETLLQSLV